MECLNSSPMLLLEADARPRAILGHHCQVVALILVLAFFVNLDKGNRFCAEATEPCSCPCCTISSLIHRIVVGRRPKQQRSSLNCCTDQRSEELFSDDRSQNQNDALIRAPCYDKRVIANRHEDEPMDACLCCPKN